MGKANGKKKTKELKKNKRNITKLVSIFLLVVIILAGGFGIYFLKTSEKFNIQNIQVVGNTYYTADEICVTSGIVVGENLFKLSKVDIKENLNILPYIKEVEVSRKLPSTITLKITERNICYVAYAKDSGEYILLDEEGVMLSKIDSSEVENKLLMFGLNFDDNIVLGESLTEIELEKLKSFTNIYNIYIQSEINMKVTSVEFKGAKLTLTLDNQIDVVIADNSEVEYKIRLLKSILKEIEAGVACKIDLTLDNPTYSIIVK